MPGAKRCLCEDRSERNLLVAQLNQSYREMFADMKGLLGESVRPQSSVEERALTEGSSCPAASGSLQTP